MKYHQQHNLVSRDSNVDIPFGLVDELDFDVEKELLALIVPLGFIIISSGGKEYVYRWGVVYRTFNTNKHLYELMQHLVQFSLLIKVACSMAVPYNF